MMQGKVRQCLCCVRCARRVAALTAARPMVARWSQNKCERRHVKASMLLHVNEGREVPLGATAGEDVMQAHELSL